MGVSATHEIVFEAWLAACFPKKIGECLMTKSPKNLKKPSKLARKHVATPV
jgi:hypothetical protein